MSQEIRNVRPVTLPYSIAGRIWDLRGVLALFALLFALVITLALM